MARQEEVARDYLKRAARTDELNGHPPGSDGPMLTALKMYSGGRVLVFVMVRCPEVLGQASRNNYVYTGEIRSTQTTGRGAGANREKKAHPPCSFSFFPRAHSPVSPNGAGAFFPTRCRPALVPSSRPDAADRRLHRPLSLCVMGAQA